METSTEKFHREVELLDSNLLPSLEGFSQYKKRQEVRKLPSSAGWTKLNNVWLFHTGMKHQILQADRKDLYISD